MNTKPSNAKTKKKLCWNCEGSTSFEDENCPYCGVYLSPLSLTDKNDLAPPYQIEEEESQEIPEAPYAQEPNKSIVNEIEKAVEPSNDAKGMALASVFFLGGILFLLFGLTLLLFSKNGVLTLRWNGDLWFVYLAVAAPMLFFAYRALQKIKE